MSRVYHAFFTRIRTVPCRSVERWHDSGSGINDPISHPRNRATPVPWGQDPGPVAPPPVPRGSPAISPWDWPSGPAFDIVEQDPRALKTRGGGGSLPHGSAKADNDRSRQDTFRPGPDPGGHLRHAHPGPDPFPRSIRRSGTQGRRTLRSWPIGAGRQSPVSDPPRPGRDRRSRLPRSSWASAFGWRC